MGSSIGPQTVTSGLVYNLDAANRSSISNSAVNLLTASEDFSNAVWLTSNPPTVTANYTYAPDGTLTADRVYFPFGNNTRAFQTTNLALGKTVTFSVWMKNNVSGTQSVSLYFREQNFGPSWASNTVTVTNTWERFSITFTVPTSGSTGSIMSLVYLSGYTEIWDLSMWGAQLEYGSSPTTYYPVNASTQPSTTVNNLVSTGPLLDNLTQVEVLVVAGGGGGTMTGSGGGAGGVIYNASFPVTTSTSYTVTVGDGGLGGPYPTNNPTVGGNSIFGSLTAYGGGYGVSHGASVGSNGGSGGGAAQVFTTSTSCSPGLGIDGQGFMGGQTPIGTGLAWDGGSAGGGGAGGPGQRGGANIQGYGAGGIGRYFAQFSTIGGSPAGWFGGGGGGGEVSHGFITEGGLGGGGTGTPDAVGSNGIANTGGGGAGGGYNGPYYGGGNGGSGIVIVRYQGVPKATGGIITSVNGYTIHTFKSGTSTFTVNGPASGVLSGGLVYTELNSGGLVFNGSTSYVPITDIADQFASNKVTIFSFAKISSSVSKPTCVSFNATFNVFYPGIRINATPTQMYWDSTAGWKTANTQNLSVDQIYCFAWTIDRTSLTFYLNGQSDGTATVTNFAPTSPVRLGLANAGEYHTGTVYNLLVYNRALSAAEILNNFNALRGRYSI